MAKGRRTFQAKSTRRRARVHGYLARITFSGHVLRRRRLKNRTRLTVV